jgi:hypothetical protein
MPFPYLSGLSGRHAAGNMGFYKSQSAAAESAYLDYFKNTQKAFALKIEEFMPFTKPVDPWKTPGFFPPQSFRYNVRFTIIYSITCLYRACPKTN